MIKSFLTACALYLLSSTGYAQTAITQNFRADSTPIQKEVKEAVPGVNPFSGKNLLEEKKSSENQSAASSNVVINKSQPEGTSAPQNKETPKMKEAEKTPLLVSNNLPKKEEKVEPTCAPVKLAKRKKSSKPKAVRHFGTTVIVEEDSKENIRQVRDCARCESQQRTAIRVLEIHFQEIDAYAIIVIAGQTYIAANNASTPLGQLRLIDATTIEIEGESYSITQDDMRKVKKKGNVTVFN